MQADTQVDPHVKIGSAKVLRKKTPKECASSRKFAKSQRRLFEQPPVYMCVSVYVYVYIYMYIYIFKQSLT